MTKTLIGTNTFGIKKELTADFDGTLKTLKDMGIDCIEPIIFKHKTQTNIPKSLWSDELVDHAVPKLKELGITLRSAHFGAGFMGMTLPVKSLTKNLLEAHEKTGITTFISSGIFDSERQAKRFAKTMGELAENLSPYGIEILFHNHDDELAKTKKGDKTLLDVYFENTSDKVGLELDIGWTSLKCDEIEVMKKYSDKIAILHCKDFFKSPSELSRKTAVDSDFAPIGEGTVKHKEAIELIKTFPRYDNYIVLDQDHSAGNMLDDIKIGVNNIRSYLE